MTRPGPFLLLACAFVGAALVVYEPALEGPFVSDVMHYVATNPYVHDLTLSNVIAVLDPRSAATIFVVNYAPVQMLIHALEWQVFGDDVVGFHVVNVVLHGIASALLVLVLLASGVPQAGALVGGADFLLHPANVEAVAWISQLKSSSALLLALAAILAYPRRAALASALFALALLAKATAAFALPVVALIDWSRSGRVRVRWLALWAAILGVYALAEFATHQRSGAAEPLHGDFFVLAPTIVALALRYLVMAATSLGVSAFHEPRLVTSLADPWWLAGAAVLAALAWRSVWALRARREEAAYWAWAAASFLPVSQIFPFLYPMADRYLYFILPGLIGAVLLAGDEWLGRSGPRRKAFATAALALGAALCAAFAVHAHERARIWSSPAKLLADASRHYPDGVVANLVRARQSARQGDADGALAALRAAVARGYNRYQDLDADPSFAAIRGDPRFAALLHELAAGWIERLRGHGDNTQIELRVIAQAHLARGERAEALSALEAAVAMEGPIREVLREDLRTLRGSAGGPEH